MTANAPNGSLSESRAPGSQAPQVDGLMDTMTVMALSKPYSFETFPAEIRLAILRMLLLCDEDHEAIDVNDEGYGLHPAIMRCNKLIHEEAAGVLYGENVFVYFLDGLEHCKLWHSHSYWSNTKSLLSRRNSRLISMVYLNLDLVDNNGELSFDYERNDVDTLKSNIRHAVDTLSLSDLKILKIRCRDTYVSGTYDIHLNKWGDMPYFGQECLEDWLRARATRFDIVWNGVDPKFAAQLKAIIEGPTNDTFFASRREKEAEEESDLEHRDEGVLAGSKRQGWWINEILDVWGNNTL